MSQLLLEVPETLQHQLETLARRERVSLNQYILFVLTRQAILAYTVQAVPDSEVAQQRTAFVTLLQNLGQASFAEIEQVLQEREVVTPEVGLTPKVMKRLQKRIANQQQPA
ncbi:MAG: toxin-antitoxin system HicB family antitoxin [candidate division KSB1 bacterium]|nr:toxin-antitoxin system HicB family antitoxin [candidate division KSB1 bacterium]